MEEKESTFTELEKMTVKTEHTYLSFNLCKFIGIKAAAYLCVIDKLCNSDTAVHKTIDGSVYTNISIKELTEMTGGDSMTSQKTYFGKLEMLGLISVISTNIYRWFKINHDVCKKYLLDK